MDQIIAMLYLSQVLVSEMCAEMRCETAHSSIQLSRSSGVRCASHEKWGLARVEILDGEFWYEEGRWECRIRLYVPDLDVLCSVCEM